MIFDKTIASPTDDNVTHRHRVDGKSFPSAHVVDISRCDSRATTTFEKFCSLPYKFPVVEAMKAANQVIRLANVARSNHLELIKRTDSGMTAVRGRLRPAARGVHPVKNGSFRQKVITALGIQGIEHVFDRRKHPLER